MDAGSNEQVKRMPFHKFLCNDHYSIGSQSNANKKMNIDYIIDD